MHDTATNSRGHRFRYVVYGGLLAGALDLIYICCFVAILYDIGPQRILHSIAAGWVGRDAARAGGAATAALGFVSHFAIAVVMAIVYFLAAKRLPALVRHPWRYGALYGLTLYLAMNYVVVPLSAAGDGMKALQWVDLAHVAAHVLLVGIPCALSSAFALGARPRLFARIGATA
jgi:hypothetical protein